MNFGEAIKSGFRNYVNFSGRAPRSEYWYWTLFAVIVTIVADGIDIVIGTDSSVGIVGTVAGLALFLPGLAISFRRLHDLDRTAWWLLIVFTGIGAIVLVIWDCIKGTTGPNRFGPDPLGG